MLTRRKLLQQTAAAAAFAPLAQAQEGPVLIDNPKGNFRFLKGSGPYSSGAVAHSGYEVVHTVFNPLPPLEKAFGLIESHLKAEGRPLHALCGMELRIPKALTFEGFNKFNQPYIKKLKSWDTHVDGLNPVARTNVALEVNPVAVPSVNGFSYTMPSDQKRNTFVVAGAGELRSSTLAGDEIVRRGDVSEAGLREKAVHVLGIMATRLKGMGVSWADATASDIYCVHDIHPLMAKTILPLLHEGSRHGVRWYFSRPPIIEIEYEMDVRGVRREIVLAG